MTSSDSTLQPGTILDSGTMKYRITGVLGQGGFGITYLVMGEVRSGNITTEARFAIKEHFPSSFCFRDQNVVVPKDDKIPEYYRSKSDFISEAKKLHALGTANDNIVKVNEVFEANGTAYYVMQYINGVSLSTYVKSKGKLKYREAITLLSPIIDAVGYLHKSRINHLDIKPDNIMLNESLEGTTPVLIDFGLCVHFKKNGAKTSPKGVQGVSAGYSPLEQYAGLKEFIPATDIYALMATLLYMLTGTAPKEAAEIKMSEVRSTLSGLVPHDVIDGICKAMNKSYEDRTDSIPALKSDLKLSSSGCGTPTTVIDIEEDKKKHKRICVVAGAAIGVIIIAMILWLMPHGEKQADVTSDENKIDSADVTDRKDTTINITTVLKPTPETRIEQNKRPKERAGQTKSTPAVTNGTLSLNYGTWTGGIRNGKPDGKGTLVFNSTHAVDKRSSYEANPGDYFVATYENGSLISGKLYDESGNLLKTIIP